MNRNSEKWGNYLLYTGVAIALGFTIVYGLSYFRLSPIDPPKAGVFGDFIGGVVGSLWALAGIMFFYSALSRQKEQLEIQREELQHQREELRNQRQEIELQRISLVMRDQVQFINQQMDALKVIPNPKKPDEYLTGPVDVSWYMAESMLLDFSDTAKVQDYFKRHFLDSGNMLKIRKAVDSLHALQLIFKRSENTAGVRDFKLVVKANIGTASFGFLADVKNLQEQVLSGLKSRKDREDLMALRFLNSLNEKLSPVLEYFDADE